MSGGLELPRLTASRRRASPRLRRQAFSLDHPRSGTTRTGQRDLCNTRSVTLPRTAWARPPCPWVPITIKSAPSSCARLMISTCGLPSLLLVSQGMPACSSPACHPGADGGRFWAEGDAYGELAHEPAHVGRAICVRVGSNVTETRPSAMVRPPPLDAHHPGEWQLPKLQLLAAFQLSKGSVERAEWAFGCINHGFQDEAVGEVSLGLFPGLQGCFENGGGLNI